MTSRVVKRSEAVEEVAALPPPPLCACRLFASSRCSSASERTSGRSIGRWIWKRKQPGGVGSASTGGQDQHPLHLTCRQHKNAGSTPCGGAAASGCRKESDDASRASGATTTGARLPSVTSPRSPGTLSQRKTTGSPTVRRATSAASRCATSRCRDVIVLKKLLTDASASARRTPLAVSAAARFRARSASDMSGVCRQGGSRR